MPTTTTALILAGPRDASWLPSFNPTYLLTLREGSRAAWLVDRLGPGPAATRRVRVLPESPDFLLWSGVLGLLCVTAPTELALHPTLPRLIGRRGKDATIAVLAAHDVTAIAAMAQAQVAAVVTALPDSSIGIDQRLHAEHIGFAVGSTGSLALSDGAAS